MLSFVSTKTPAQGRLLAVLPAAALIVGVMFTFFACSITRNWVHGEIEAQTEKRVETLHSELVQRLALYDQSMHAAAGFISISDDVTYEEWAGFTDSMGIASTLRGIPALAYAPVVARADLPGFIERARQEGLSDYHIWPLTNNPVLVPNRFAGPLTPSNYRALGYDMFQDPVRRAAIEAARDSGRTAITQKVTLTIDGALSNAEPAVIAYTPVYAADAPTDTVERRRAAFRGVALAPIRLPALLAEVKERLEPQAVMRLHEDDADLYAMPGGEAVTQWRERGIEFSNRRWRIEYAFPAHDGASSRDVLPNVVLVAGLIMSALLTMVLRNVVTSHDAALRLATQMTSALRDSEARFKAMFDNSVQYQSLLDVDGRLLSSNPAALSLIGGDLSSVQGHLFWEIPWSERQEESRQLQQAFLQAVRGEKAKLNVELVHRGETQLVSVSFQPVRGGDGLVSWVVAEGRDMTEWRRREEALSRAVDALTRSNQELERFAHVAAHDLQEPCRTIVSYSQLLQRRYADQLGEDGGDFLNYLMGGAHRMRDLVNDLLAYSRVKGKAEPFRDVDCNSLLRGVLDDMHGAIAESGASVSVGELPLVAGDAGQLAQLFQNLLANALKFRDLSVSPQVSVKAELKDGAWLFSVSDNGIGISPDYHRRIFDIFQRLHGSDRFPGTGIGLAICRKVVERHGGRIWVESAEGQGAVFYFTIPALDGLV